MAIGTSGKGLGGVLLVIRITGVSKEAGDGPTKKLGDTVDQDINAWSYKFSTTLGCQYPKLLPNSVLCESFWGYILSSKASIWKGYNRSKDGPKGSSVLAFT
jgi:hypothetical protein